MKNRFSEIVTKFLIQKKYLLRTSAYYTIQLGD